MSGSISSGIPEAVATFLPLLEQVGEGIQIFDAQGCLLYANEVAAQSFGFETSQTFLTAHQGQFGGSEIVALNNPAGDSLTPAEYPCVQALKGKKVSEQILHFMDYQRRDRCLAMRALPLRDDTGTVQYAAVLSRDLTDLQATTQSLEQKNQQLYQIVDVLPSSVACLDPQECHVYANQTYLKAFRVTADELPGSTLQSVVGPVIYQQLRQPLQRAFSGEVADVCLPIKGLRPRLQYERVSIIPQLEGQVIAGVYLILNQIAAHKHTDDLLQTETDFFRHSLEAASVGTQG
ncbi:MAG: PAS domain-containing protein [Leptolyngbya sp. SIOISBB]|nr:PAS domain-containing protein [Leptolyngbya sp. SIOISBB]